MMNRELKEYLNGINNKDKNYKEILSKMEGVSSMKRYKKIILNIAAIFICVILVGTVSTKIYAKIQWDIQFKEYQNRPFAEARGNLNEIRESDYAEVLNMDYLTQDGISIKIDSILMTDDCFDANITFKFPEDTVINSETFGFGYAIYDEKNNIYFVGKRTHIGSNEKYDKITPFIYKELGVKYNKHDIYAIQLADSASEELVEANVEERTINKNINLTAEHEFPKSKKIFIRIFDLGYFMVDINDKKELKAAENFKLSDSEWIFEIDVPEKFNERENIKLKLKDEISDIKLEEATLSETGLVLRVKGKENFNFLKETDDLGKVFTITDNDGKIYQDSKTSMVVKDKVQTCKITFDVGKKDLDKKLFLNYTMDGKKYTSELIEK